MSVDSTISMALTLHGDATVESRSNAVAASIRNMGTAYRGYAKHARHSRYAMSGVNFLTGGMLSRVGTRLREQFGEIESGLGRTMSELGALLGGGLGYELGRMAPDIARSTASTFTPGGAAQVDANRRAATAVAQARAAAHAAKTAQVATTGAVSGFAAAVGGFVVASAAAVVAAMVAGYLVGQLGDYISREVQQATTGGQFEMDQPGVGRFAGMTAHQRSLFAQGQRDRALEQAGIGDLQGMQSGPLRWLDFRIDFLAMRIRNQEAQLQEQLAELHEIVRQGQLVTEREQRDMSRAVYSLGRL